MRCLKSDCILCREESFGAEFTHRSKEHVSHHVAAAENEESDPHVYCGRSHHPKVGLQHALKHPVPAQR